MTMLTMQRMFVAAMAVAASAGALADDQPGKQCSDATLRGTYGIQMQGTRPSSPGGPVEAVIGVAIRYYDGTGGVVQTDNIKGAISGYVPDRPGFGTYRVNEDCSVVIEVWVMFEMVLLFVCEIAWLEKASMLGWL